MGIHGLFPQIGPGTRIALAKLAVNHYTTHDKPLRLAVDISIWLFQIQSGKGGSNPALRTFYYRLLRLLTLNIHPLFVFDGPNKPLFKRNKKVGGPGVRVANVPEFLAKQLLKQFGFPWHVAPGEAEAECALLQREGLVDAVLSEDVDTLMFGSDVTLRNWTSENSGKVPTHVSVYRADKTLAKSGLDGQGMILVALMSGGDYLPDGIPGCGPKVACDAARAGFGKELCALRTKDTAAIQEWKDRLTHEIKTNESKFFSRKNPAFNMPEDFPNLEVLGYYTHPCISNADKVSRLKDTLKWDQPIDFPALRTFTADAFDWRCLGGAKKFIRNLAPAMLVRELRLRGDVEEDLEEDARRARENELIAGIHGKRNHATTDGELEYRISFTPADLVPIDLSIEDEDDEFLVAGGEDSDAEFETLPSESNPSSEAPGSPTKRRVARPYDPSEAEKLWLLKPLIQIGCPLLVECYEANLRGRQEVLDARRKAKDARDAAKKASPKKAAPVQSNTMMSYARVTKPTVVAPEKEKKVESAPHSITDLPSIPEAGSPSKATSDKAQAPSGFRLPSTRVPSSALRRSLSASSALPGAVSYDGSPSKTRNQRKRPVDPERTPRRKRRSPEPSSPSAQRPITTFFHSSPTKSTQNHKVVDLICSPIEPKTTPPFVRFGTSDQTAHQAEDDDLSALPDTVTKRRRRKGALSRSQTAPTLGDHDDFQPEDEMEFINFEQNMVLPAHADTSSLQIMGLELPRSSQPPIDTVDLLSSSPAPPPRPIPAAASAAPTTLPAAKARQATKKKHIQLRESLEGAWKEVDELDLTGIGSVRKARKGWRMSTVSVLDLTDV